MKLPEKLKGTYIEQGQLCDTREAKINEIIDYLASLEQQKPKHECTFNHCIPKCINENGGGIVREL